MPLLKFDESFLQGLNLREEIRQACLRFRDCLLEVLECRLNGLPFLVGSVGLEIGSMGQEVAPIGQPREPSYEVLVRTYSRYRARYRLRTPRSSNPGERRPAVGVMVRRSSGFG